MTRHADALVLRARGELEARSLPVPDLLAGEALLRVEACGLCGTDHELFSGAMPAALPLVPGHEIIGVIEEATDDYLVPRSLKIGARVALEVFQTCTACEACRTGANALCRIHGLRDSYGNTPLGVGAGLWGGYATHVLLTRDSVVHPVPPSLDPVVATLFNPLGAGVRWGWTLPGIGPGAVVAVLGPGLRGLGALVAASAAGARYVMVTGTGPADRERLEAARRLGAARTVDVTAEDAKAVLKAETGGLADLVVDVTAAAPGAFVQALDVARPGGTVVVAGTRGTHTLNRFSPDRIVLKELRVLGARGVDSPAYRQALEILTDDVRLHDVQRMTAPLDAGAVAELLDLMAHGPDRPLHAVVVIDR